MIDMTSLLEQHGEATVLATGGLVLGLMFGFAQRSKFCLRAAVINSGAASWEKIARLAVGVSSTAVVLVQLLILRSVGSAVSNARQLATPAVCLGPSWAV